MDKKTELAKRLKHWRTERKLTQEKLAELSDMTRKAVSSYENARVFLSFDAAKKLGKALNISPMFLMCETDDPFDSKSFAESKEKNIDDEKLQNALAITEILSNSFTAEELKKFGKTLIKLSSIIEKEE